MKKLNSLDKRPVSTPPIVSRVNKKIHVEDPPSQRSIAQFCRISQSTVSRIIKSANFIIRKKRKIHKLTLSTAEKRHKRAVRLYRQFVTEISLHQTNRGFISMVQKENEMFVI